ncbi:hypothetical protein BX616_005437 [Lobosporangium transversale]|nr:hypothetical protein BX616_005437 [Lobosporangium transversale]
MLSSNKPTDSSTPSHPQPSLNDPTLSTLTPVAESNPHPPRMQRFTRPEDLADLEVLNTRVATALSDEQGHRQHPQQQQQQQHRELLRRYMDAHTTFLNSSDTEGSGYIPGRVTTSLFTDLHSHGDSYHVYRGSHGQSPLSSSIISSSSLSIPLPLHTTTHDGPSSPSFTEDDEYGSGSGYGYTAPGSPQSIVSSASLSGYYYPHSHPSRPLSQTGFWADQAASSFNLIMPSSAMFATGKEPTADGDKLGFVKLMIGGRSRKWHTSIIQDIFKWEGIIANDFEDEFLHEPPPLPPPQLQQPVAQVNAAIINVATATVAAHEEGIVPSVGVGDDVNEPKQQRQREMQQLQQKRVQYEESSEVIVEHYASSMVLPAWARAGLDYRDTQQEILVKNICFVDTPGYDTFSNPNRAMDLVMSYVGLQFQTTNEFFSRSARSDDALGRFLANNTTGAHSHVDVCIYVIEGQLTEQDIAYMQRLQTMVNLVPLILMTPNITTQAVDVAAIRSELIRQLCENDIEIYGMVESGSGRGGGVRETRAFSADSPYLTHATASEEEELSPPPLSLGEGLLCPEFTSPPFVYFVPQASDSKVQVEGQSAKNDKKTESNLHASPSFPLALPSASSLTSDLGSVRKWIFVEHLAALRHHTTLKFLRWRRNWQVTMASSPSLMYSSMESGSSSLRQRQHSSNHGSNNSINNSSASRVSNNAHSGQHLIPPNVSDYLSGPQSQSRVASVNVTATHNLPSSTSVGPSPLSHQQQRHSPTVLVGELLARERKRISLKVARMLETHSQVFERIMLERKEAWRQALQGIEREQRIDFLVQEIKRWAMAEYHTHNQTQNQTHSLGSEYPIGNIDSASYSYRTQSTSYHQQQKHQHQYQQNPQVRHNYRHPYSSSLLSKKSLLESRRSSHSNMVGLGLEAGGPVVPLDAEPSLLDVLDLQQPQGSEHSGPSITGKKNSNSTTAITTDTARHQHSQRKSLLDKKTSPSRSRMNKQGDSIGCGRDQAGDKDPLGLGLWMSQLFGAVGNGIIHVVAIVGMSSLATFIYTHFLEHRVTWIG